MNTLSAYAFIDGIVVTLLLLFSILVLGLKSGDKLGHRLLSAFFICLALSYMDGVFVSFKYFFHHSYVHMVYITMSFDFLIGPLLLLYILSRTNHDFGLKKHHLLHAVPFVLHFSFIFFRFHIHSTETKLSMLAGHQVFSYQEVYALTTTSTLHITTYIVSALYVLFQYRREIKNQFSNIHSRNLNWLILICFGLFFGGLLRFANNLMWLTFPHSEFHYHVDLKIFAISSVFIFACSVIYKSFQETHVMRISLNDVENINRRTAEKSTPQQQKYSTTAILPNISVAYSEMLTEYMNTVKPYLNSDLSLSELAEGIEIPTHHLSQVINSEFKMNFYDYINRYRIEECIALFKDPENQQKNIAEMMYSAGFNSKSVFNRIFKEITQKTPSAYRKDLDKELVEMIERERKISASSHTSH